MKVSELIEKLKLLPQDLEVYTYAGEQGQCPVVNVTIDNMTYTPGPSIHIFNKDVAQLEIDYYYQETRPEDPSVKGKWPYENP